MGWFWGWEKGFSQRKGAEKVEPDSADKWLESSSGNGSGCNREGAVSDTSRMRERAHSGSGS